MTKIKFSHDLLPWPLKVADGDFMFLWCCDCHLRHVYHVRIMESPDKKERWIELDCVRDDIATELRRFYERQKKKLKRRKDADRTLAQS